MKEKKHKTYSFDLKKKIVELYLEGHSAAELAQEYGISNRRSVNDWVMKVQTTGTYDSLKDRRGLANAGQPRERKQSLEEENERLRMEIYYLKKLITVKGR